MVEIYSAKKPSKHKTANHSKIRRKRLDFTLKSAFETKTPHDVNGFTSSFCYYPERVSFINEDPEEEVILLLRRHLFSNVRWIVTAIILFFLPLLFSSMSIFGKLPPGYQVILVVIWYLITMAFVLEEYLSWFFHVNIVTDERIIDVDFTNLIYREMTDANIDQIQDVTVKIGGGARTFLNYGDVVIQTAAEIPQLTFEAVPRPDVVAKILRELRVEEEQEKLDGRVR